MLLSDTFRDCRLRQKLENKKRSRVETDIFAKKCGCRTTVVNTARSTEQAQLPCIKFILLKYAYSMRTSCIQVLKIVCLKSFLMLLNVGACRFQP